MWKVNQLFEQYSARKNFKSLKTSFTFASKIKENVTVKKALDDLVTFDIAIAVYFIYLPSSRIPFNQACLSNVQFRELYERNIRVRTP